MDHAVNKPAVKSIKKETDMILAKGTCIVAILNKSSRIRRIKRNIKIRTVRCKDIVSAKTVTGREALIEFFE